MTSNAGTEYINLKQAKYNRDMRNENVRNKISVPAGASNGSRSAVYAAHTNRTQESVSAPSRKQMSLPLQKEYGAKEFAGDVAGELLDAYARKRKEAARRKANSPVYVKKYVKEKTALPISMIGYIIVFSAIAMFLVLGNSKINEAILRADTLKSEIAEEMSRAEILNASLNKRNDVTYIEDYAVNVLGMVKSTDVAKRYVSISGEDKVVVSGGTGGSGAENNHTSAAVTLSGAN